MPAIASISVYVDNMDKAVDFYSAKLGFEVEAKPNPYITVLKHDGVALVLCHGETAHTLKYPQEAGTVIGLATGKLTAEVTRLKSAGVEFVIDSPQDMPCGKYIAVRDPSGNVVEVIEFER